MINALTLYNEHHRLRAGPHKYAAAEPSGPGLPWRPPSQYGVFHRGP